MNKEETLIFELERLYTRTLIDDKILNTFSINSYSNNYEMQEKIILTVYLYGHITKICNAYGFTDMMKNEYTPTASTKAYVRKVFKKNIFFKGGVSIAFLKAKIIFYTKQEEVDYYKSMSTRSRTYYINELLNSI